MSFRRCYRAIIIRKEFQSPFPIVESFLLMIKGERTLVARVTQVGSVSVYTASRDARCPSTPQVTFKHALDKSPALQSHKHTHDNVADGAQGPHEHFILPLGVGSVPRYQGRHTMGEWCEARTLDRRPGQTQTLGTSGPLASLTTSAEGAPQVQ